MFNASIGGSQPGGSPAVGTVTSIVASGVTLAGPSVALVDAIPVLTPTFTTWVNQGGNLAYNTPANAPSALVLSANAGANNVRARTKALAAGDFTLLANLGFLGTTGTNAPPFGIVASDGTHSAVFNCTFNRATLNFGIDIWSATGTFGSNVVNPAFANQPNPIWMKVALVGTTWTYSISLDGTNFLTIGTTTTAAIGGTPNLIGIGVEEFGSATNGVPQQATLNYWSGA